MQDKHLQRSASADVGLNHFHASAPSDVVSELPQLSLAGETPTAEPASAAAADTCADTAAAAVAQEAPYPWIIHPVIDVLFCCGVFPIILYGIMCLGYRLNPFEPVGFGLWLLFIVGMHVFQDAHGVASWHRILTHKETMESARRYFILITVAAVLAFFPLLLNQGLLLICARIYLLIGVQHWLMQSYGVTLIYFFKRGYKLNALDKRLVLLLFQSIIWFAWIRFFTIKDYGNADMNGFEVAFIGPLPPWVMGAAEVWMFLVLAAVAFRVIRHYITNKQMMPFPSILLIVTTIWVYTLTADAFWLVAYFIGAFYHGSQSWCVTTSFHCKAKGLPEDITYGTIWKVFFRKSTWLYLLLLFVVSELIYTVAPRLLAQFGISFGVAFATMVVVFSTHHFMCDSAIWKLKNPKVRALLIK